MEEFNIDSIFVGNDEKAPRPPAKFHIAARKDEHLTREAGKPVYVDQIYLTVHVSKNQVVDRPARILSPNTISNLNDDRREYPKEWQAFTQTDEYRAYSSTEDEEFSFTKLEDVKGIGPSTKKMLNDINIRSVEQLLEADDEALEGVKGAVVAKRRAQQYAESVDAATKAKLAAEDAALEAMED